MTYRAPIGTHDFFRNAREKTCKHCGKPFLSRSGDWGNPYYCTKECQRDARNQRRREERQDSAGPYQDKCSVCSKLFWYDRTTRAYCSNACRQLAYRQRHSL